MEGIKADKSVRLIEYLQDLVRLSSKVVYDVASYHSGLWFSEIPKQKSCFTQAWKVSEQAPEIWLEVKKHPEPPIARIPEKCEDWINIESLYDSEELPVLYSTIQQDTEEVVDGETRVAIHSLNLSVASGRKTTERPVRGRAMVQTDNNNLSFKEVLSCLFTKLHYAVYCHSTPPRRHSNCGH